MDQSVSGHRWARRVTAALVGVVVVLQAVVLLARANDRTAPLAVGDAVERFRATTSVLDGAGPAPEDDASPAAPDAAVVPVRAASAAPAQPTEAAATTPAGGAATSESTQPPFGVYVYATDGFEEVDAFGGSRHDYPSETTITYSGDDCGVRVRWAPLEDRYDEKLLCRGPAGDEARWFESGRAFFGQSDHRRMTCEPGSVARPVPATVGQQWSMRCGDDRTDARSEATVIDVGPMNVAGTTVPAVHIRGTTHVTGDSDATSTTDLWVHAETGLVLRHVNKLDGSSPSPAGNVAYRERYTIELTSMTPRT